MKKGFWFIFFVSFFMVSCGIEAIYGIKGNGNVVERNYDLSRFQKLDMLGSMDVVYYKSNSYRATVVVDENIQPYVLVEEGNNTLRLKMKPGSFSYKKLLIKVYAPDLSSVDLIGSGDFKANDKITANKFWGAVSGSGNFRGTLDCEKVEMAISGSGDVKVGGKTQDLNVRISGSGNFNGKSLQSENANIKVSGSGDVTVFATESLDAVVSGSGDVRYLGNPRLNTKTSGSGSIHKL
ncbi:head GIN domain-containing protein [Ornithobacterium rhinotracheale]|uniref:Putative auto-transporter adhesin head GIN domain-containing protein n=1 Tax=Ornithobacterium rhinotracheale (strain ATCC 51463 / DSM 15997 / CCUG 23171 / CIP 104009 / LMG 9086) TaxID=867902 RepID=I4A1J5_ORNRL|nr:head GIN domain-containing protein [Ornithobacterium rhinotracheale]AFL97829.1 Protein of unknown function (DUF2807) [Ornithobacterium rhinotracheale DSM 15997]AIP99655.1 hypothetical protein Q785_08210 [Ornithobacterium rhinotracheale ORT-UMN 88]KGB66182.1 hypothetical protein Q787_08020 [Ornithobacterium rhinotracheale H06-030791]MCK0193874.1 DUF2807 domain-containing protein [Ornithobacterium rhinotracheale]MCK0200207.1 DUF2807 domain-containing protein [Ornithobacterium rhinotracheale]